MKKLFFASILYASSIAYAQTPAQIVQPFYPTYSKTLQCRVAMDKEHGTQHCMRLLKAEKRDTPQGKLMYLLYGGNFIDLETGKEGSYHAAAGLAGMFVLREKGRDDWELLAAESDYTVGAFGAAPEKSQWTFHEFGKDKWGFLTQHSDAHQGYAGSHYVILAHDGGKKISSSWLGASFSNTGAYGDKCEFYMGEDNVLSTSERKACLAKLADVSSSIKILRDKPAINGFYPLQITLKGFMSGKKFNNQAHILNFNVKKMAYIKPKNYPLANIDY